MSRVRVCGFRVFKYYPSREKADTALVRADWLGRHGVLTPGGVLARRGRMAQFPTISGKPGLSAVDSETRRIDPALLQPIVRLHALTPALPLPQFDPLAKIVPRLDDEADALLRQAVASALEVIDSFEQSNAVIHGDLHAGQLIIDETGLVWLLDLDDLSTGDPAADIGNFAAHLATRDKSGHMNPQASLLHWMQAALAAYGEAGGHVNPALASAYGTLSLIRRALKFRERGDPGLLTALGSVSSV
jgi:Phosphotransferase enzyme family